MYIDTLIIGYGEIGKALEKVLSSAHNIYVRDKNSKLEIQSVGVLHICFPYSRTFVRDVKKYKQKYNPKYTIIHSTIPLGISKKCDAFYSPVRGIHPHLEQSLKTFIKYCAPKNKFLEKYFADAGIPIEMVKSRESLEAMKLYCTTLYGLNIIAEKEIWDFCKKNKLDFDLVYTKSNKTYNEGYNKIGFPEYTKYILKHMDGKIGGHCVMPNCDLLKTDISKFIKLQNKKYL